MGKGGGAGGREKGVSRKGGREGRRTLEGETSADIVASYQGLPSKLFSQPCMEKAWVRPGNKHHAMHAIAYVRNNANE